MPITAVAAPAPAVDGAGAPGPAMLTSGYDRANALACYGDPEATTRPPVLLVPGTSVTPMENWGPAYLPVLLDRGHPVCTVRLPGDGTGDVQASVEYVATAIRALGARTSQRISIIGHSQGAFLPRVALRTWPDLAAQVDDVIGIAGVYDGGSEAVARSCATRCLPALHQLAAGSTFLAQVGRRALPTGPSYTNIGTLNDQTITPQPMANGQLGAHSIILQDVCPDYALPQPAHAMIIGDALTLSLTLDALDHPGTADQSRVDPEGCAEREYPEFDAAEFRSAAGSQSSGTAEPVTTEPPLYCRDNAWCRSPRLRGYLVDRVHYRIGQKRVAVRIRAQLTGRIRVTLGGRSVARTVQPGRVVLHIRRPAKRKRLTIRTRPQYYAAWAVEVRRPVKGRR